VFGPAARFPYAADRSYTPPDAPLENYLAMLDTLGFARGVLVQGSAHGSDNSAMLEAAGNCIIAAACRSTPRGCSRRSCRSSGGTSSSGST
jgi:hypothetical protein